MHPPAPGSMPVWTASHGLGKPFLSSCLSSIRILLLPCCQHLFVYPRFLAVGLTEKWELFCFVLFIIVVHETHYTVLSLKCFAVNHCGEDKQNNIDGEEIKENLGGFHWLVVPEFLNSDSRVSQKGTKNFSSCAWGLTDSPWWLRSKASLLRLSPINLAGCALQGLNATFLPAPHQEESGCFSGPCRVSPCT